MNKYIRDFQTTGICTLNIEKVYKDWHDGFYLKRYNGESGAEYTFIVTGKKLRNRQSVKVSISEEQATEIISRLGLIPVRNTIFQLILTYHTKSFIASEIKRIEEVRAEKRNEISYINRTLSLLNQSLDNY